MKTKINIPNPCGEDWNKMTPTEKGAYCDKCAFEVIDFSNQSPEEIKATLKSRMGQKTCGHISRTQMDMLNTNYHIWENQTLNIFRSKFLYACLMVFGFSLFTACGTSEDEEEIRVGMMEPEHEVGDIDVGMIEEDTTYQVGEDTVQCIEPAQSCEDGDIIEGDILIDGLMEIEDSEE